MLELVVNVFFSFPSSALLDTARLESKTIIIHLLVFTWTL